MPPSKFSVSTHLRVGVLLAPPPVQLLDLSPIDLFFMLSKEYLGGIPIVPGPIKALALHNINIYYIADSNSSGLTVRKSANGAQDSDGDTTLAELTAHLNLLITRSVISPDVQPGELDVILVPGSDPSSAPSEECRKFLQNHAESGQTDIISVCTGIYPLCYSGICDGHTVTGPRGLLSDLRSKFTNVKKFEDLRWTRDTFNSVSKVAGKNDKGPSRNAELWTAAGITNGQDCVAAYIKEHFNQDLAETVCRVAEVGDRDREYPTGQVSEGFWWVSRILRAAIRG